MQLQVSQKEVEVWSNKLI